MHLRKSLSVLVITAALAVLFFVAFDFTGAANSPGCSVDRAGHLHGRRRHGGRPRQRQKVGSTITITVV